MSDESIQWSPDSMLEITLKQPDDFLKIRETLSRIGVASRKDKILYQSCHILHKQGKYYIVHFKELFALDGKKATLIQNDIQRRNTVASLLQDWSLLSIVKKEAVEDKAPLSQIKIIAFKEKKDWNLQAKYNIGKKPSTDVKKEPSTSEVLAKGFAEEQEAIKKEEEEEEESTADLAAENKEEDSRPSDTEPKVSET
jgi:hypothetical protein|tara:strand:- start:14 stop:604 length:591 start_codon:yes stop_codon:yes gene_type:complete